jgi:radical SAM protein with 4Fe4S-binding SPASM domain
MIINWEGDVYPCTGGEVWFSKKVKSGQYHFGNLIKEHLSDFWNNETYTKIRRTCSRHDQEAFIPECHNCHNTLCFKGPDVKNGHILELPQTQLSPVS